MSARTEDDIFAAAAAEREAVQAGVRSRLGTVLAEHAKRHGWTPQEQLDVLLAYLADRVAPPRNPSVAGLGVFLNGRVPRRASSAPPAAPVEG